MILDLHAKGLNAKQILPILKDEFGKHAYSLASIYNWLVKARLGQQSVDDAERSGRPLDEQLLTRIQEMLDEHPFSSVRSISRTLNSPSTTIWRYLTHHLGLVYKHSKWVPHMLSADQKQKRVNDCSELAIILERCKHNGWRDIITGDQSWFVCSYGEDGAWLYPEDEAPIMDGSTIGTIKFMVTVIWGVHGIYLVDILPEGESYNSRYFIEKILRPLADQKDFIWPTRGKRKIWLHLDNCKVHNSKVTQKEIISLGFKRTPHPPYSPDIAPSDFFLFGYTKGKLKKHISLDPEDLLHNLWGIFSSISDDMKRNVFKAWIKRCNRVAMTGGDYYEDE
jgi:histone-lysine N-methyltransferase SETMAR